MPAGALIFSVESQSQFRVSFFQKPNHDPSLTKVLLWATGQQDLDAIRRIVESGYNYWFGLIQAFNLAIGYTNYIPNKSNQAGMAQNEKVLEYFMSIPQLRTIIRQEPRTRLGRSDESFWHYESPIAEAAKHNRVNLMRTFMCEDLSAVAQSQALLFISYESKEMFDMMLAEPAIMSNHDVVAIAIGRAAAWHNTNNIDKMLNKISECDKPMVLDFALAYLRTSHDSLPDRERAIAIVMELKENKLGIACRF